MMKSLSREVRASMVVGHAGVSDIQNDAMHAAA